MTNLPHTAPTGNAARMRQRVANRFAAASTLLFLAAPVLPLTVWPDSPDASGRALALILGAVTATAGCVLAVGAAVVRRLDR